MSHRLAQLALAAGRRQPPARDVVLDAEAGVVLPARVPERERHAHGALAVAPQPWQPLLDARDQILAPQRALEDRHAADVELRVRALEIQEACIARAHPARRDRDADGHVPIPCSSRVPAGRGRESAHLGRIRTDRCSPRGRAAQRAGNPPEPDVSFLPGALP